MNCFLYNFLNVLNTEGLTEKNENIIKVLKDKLERLNQLNAELNIKTDENEIIDDFEDIKDNKNSIDKDDPSKNDDTRY